MRNDPVLTVQDLTVRYGSRTALDHVSFAIGRGVTILLGPNGAGKTTLLAGNAAPDARQSSQIHLQSSLGRYADRIGYLPQDVRWNPAERVEPLLRYVAMMRQVKDPRTAARLAASASPRPWSTRPTSSSSTSSPSGWTSSRKPASMR